MKKYVKFKNINIGIRFYIIDIEKVYFIKISKYKGLLTRCSITKLFLQPGEYNFDLEKRVIINI